jgi:tetratricopeptide (TPR) repeat protein
VAGALRRKAGRLVGQVGRARLAQARAERKPDPAHRWWFLDEAIAAERRQTVRRLALILGTAAVVLLAIGFALRMLFPVNPKVAAVVEAHQAAERQLGVGDLAGALAEFDRAAQVAPDSPEVHVWRGVLLDKLGRSAEATQSFNLARSLLPDEPEFRVLRGQAYLALSDLDAALVDGQAAVTAQPDLIQAHLVLGNVYEAQGKTRLALIELQQVAELARAQHQDSLYVLAQSRVGYLLQQLAAEEMIITPGPGASP